MPLLALAVFAKPAHAEGDPTLAASLLTEPIPGWVPVAQTKIAREVDYIDKLEAAAIGPSGATATAAARGWREPASDRALSIVLIAITGAQGTTIPVDEQVAPAARSAATSFCTAPTGAPPFSNTPVPGIPNSYFAICQTTASGVTSAAVWWVKRNVLAGLVAPLGGVGGLPAAQIQAIALEQYKAMPTADILPVTSADSALPVVIGVIAGVAVVGIIGTVLMVRRRKKRRASATGAILPGGASAVLPAPGWYTDTRNPAKRRYWTGSEWGPDELSPVDPQHQADPQIPTHSAHPADAVLLDPTASTDSSAPTLLTAPPITAAPKSAAPITAASPDSTTTANTTQDEAADPAPPDHSSAH